ncbi:MAG: amidohydrolase [Bacteroidota bacterium]
MKKLFYITPLLFLIISCSSLKKEKAGLIVKNATIYTVDQKFRTVDAFVIKDGEFLAVGNEKNIKKQYTAEDEIDLQGKFVYPGFIDPHSHFYGYCMNLTEVGLTDTQSFDEIIEKLQSYDKNNEAEWLVGRGWDQNKWEEKKFPDKSKLDKIFPDTPVYLTRVDGHAAIVNSKALEIAGINAQTEVSGGKVIKENNEPTGVLIDNAMSLVSEKIPEPTKEEKINALQKGQQKCFNVGLTMVSDAGLKYSPTHLMDSLQKAGKLKMNTYVMLTPTQDNIDTFVKQGVYKTERMHIQSIKLFADGALGSRGACLLEPYNDDPDNYGLLVSEPSELRKLSEIAYENDFQVNTHAIGDSANRLMLDIYSDILPPKNNRRWRIEHAQVIHPNDFKLFGEYNIVPAINTTHATSDMNWADERLGDERLKNAYAYKKLLNENDWLPNGSDFPVEDINPLYGFYAAFARKGLDGKPENGFQMENALSRKEALKAMTIWAAKACFEEDERGSIEAGKKADFVVTEKDIMQAEENKVPHIKVQKTFINGEPVTN